MLWLAIIAVILFVFHRFGASGFPTVIRRLLKITTWILVAIVVFVVFVEVFGQNPVHP